MPSVALADIAGLSKFNVRQTAPAAEEIAELRASIAARGLTHPLIVREEEGEWRVLDGGRRWHTLRAMLDAGDIEINFATKVDYFVGDDEAAFEASLTSFVQRVDLHPVDQFERFIELRDRFCLDEDAIARKTGKTLRFVKENLRLARLAPQIRAAWRAGEIRADVAKAFSATDNLDAQIAMLADPNIQHCRPGYIAKQLRGDAQIAMNDSRVLFVGVDAYVAAGGRVEEQLFDDESYLLDAAILDHVVRETLEAEAEKIAQAEGWGWRETRAGVEYWEDKFRRSATPDYTDAETSRRGEIEDRIEEIAYDETEESRKEIVALTVEIDGIDGRAYRRGATVAQRAKMGVHVDYGDNGELIIERGLVARIATESTPADNEEDDGDDAGEGPRENRSSSAAPSAVAPEPIAKSLRAVLDDTASAALYDAVSRAPRLALVFAIAAIGCGYGKDCIGVSGGGAFHEEWKSPLLREIRGERFEKALTVVLTRDQDDPSLAPVAFAELVGASFTPARATNFDTVKILLAAASRHCDIDGDLKSHFDAAAWFRAAPKDAGFEAVRIMDGEAAAAAARKMKKDEFVKSAALLAKDRGWLPDVLRIAPPENIAEKVEKPRKRAARKPDARSTAQAMVEAIAADESNSAAETTRVETFIELDCRRGEGARVKASELWATFVAFGEARELPPMTFTKFAAAISALGIEKHRLKNGVHYLGVALREEEKEAAE